MQLYTKTGDKGLTKLVGGQSVAKDAERVNAYGTIDELNSWIGYTITKLDKDDKLRDELLQLQHYLFDCGSDLSTPQGVYPYKVDQQLIDWIEERIDTYAEIPPALERFILPGGDEIASMIHVARTIARRAERHIVGAIVLFGKNPERHVHGAYIQYVRFKGPGSCRVILLPRRGVYSICSLQG